MSKYAINSLKNYKIQNETYIVIFIKVGWPFYFILILLGWPFKNVNSYGIVIASFI